MSETWGEWKARNKQALDDIQSKNPEWIESQHLRGENVALHAEVERLAQDVVDKGSEIWKLERASLNLMESYRVVCFARDALRAKVDENRRLVEGAKLKGESNDD